MPRRGSSDTEGRLISAIKKKKEALPIAQGKIEMDSHAETTVAGANYYVLSHTGKECNASPCHDDHDAIQKTLIVTVEAQCQFQNAGQVHILVFHEALLMGEDVPQILINPNQMKCFGTVVQNNPTS